MDNQPLRIRGYRDLSQDAIDLMNEIKAKGEDLCALCDRLAHADSQRIDQRWATIGKTHRLAMRVEGDKWNAYLAEQDNMDGAIWLGSILLRSVSDNLKRKRAFMELMHEAVSDAVENAVGTRPEWAFNAADGSWRRSD